MVYLGEYWREAGLVRVRENCSKGGFDGRLIEFLASEGKQRSVIRQPGPAQEPNSFAVTLLIANEWRPTVLSDVWKLALMGVPPHGSESKPILSVSEAVSQFKFKNIASERGPKGSVVRLTLDDEISTYDVWLDPQVNWLIRRVVRHIHKTAKESESIAEYTIADFTEVQPGQYFPTRMVMHSEVAGKSTVTYEAEFTDVAMNTLREPPFPMKLPFYAGMPAKDEIAGTTYDVDGEGKPSGKIDVTRYAPSPTALPRPDPNTPVASSWNWLQRPATLLIGLAFGFAFGAAFLVYRRRRSERAK